MEGTVIPRIDVNNKDSDTYKQLLQKFGGADFRNAVQRNLEKDFIERTAASLSIVEGSVLSQKVNSLNAVINVAAKGGVTAEFPIEPGIGNITADTVNAPLVPQVVSLSKANVTYRVNHEAVMESGNLAENDQVVEGAEQLAGKINAHVISELDDKAAGGNARSAGALWTADAGDPYDDVNQMIGKIYDNSSLDPNNNAGNKFTLIVPIAARAPLQKYVSIDNVKTSLEKHMMTGLGVSIKYSRKPFHYKGTWPLLTTGLLIPALDRHVGKFYTFDGGAMPSMFVTEDENGKRVSTNSWMKFVVPPSEDTGSITSNVRISKISGILA